MLSVTNTNQILRYKYDMASEDEENADGFKKTKESQTPKWGSNIKDFQREREEGHALLNPQGEIR